MNRTLKQIRELVLSRRSAALPLRKCKLTSKEIEAEDEKFYERIRQNSERGNPQKLLSVPSYNSQLEIHRHQLLNEE